MISSKLIPLSHYKMIKLNKPYVALNVAKIVEYRIVP